MKSHLRKSNLQSKTNDISIDFFLELSTNKLHIEFRVTGELDNYIFPQKSNLKRADELWKATCFELFLRNTETEAYYELNFTSSLSWNFSYLNSYRAKVQEVKGLGQVKIEVFTNDNNFKIFFELETDTFSFNQFNIYNAAVILKNSNDERTFWSLGLPSKVPDFHDEKGFLKL